jgi:hypothetical protein
MRLGSRYTATLLASVSLTACGSASIPRPAYSAQLTGALVSVPHEPPPGRVEHAPVQPAGVGVVWIDGEWDWHGKKWWWTPGRWVEPAGGETYSPWCTVRAPDGALYFAPAVWRDARGAVVAGPKVLASAVVDSGVVVDPAGDMERTMVSAPK